MAHYYGHMRKTTLETELRFEKIQFLEDSHD
jgi:hypothetical protein